MKSGWIETSRARPCPVCGHAGWCTVTADGAVCLCHRKPSGWRPAGGDGFLHRLASAAPTAVRLPQDAAPERAAAHFANLPTGDIQRRLCARLERDLGLPADLLRRFDWRWDHPAFAVAIPMRDPAGNVVGIRYRALASGRKWALRGSRDGLFLLPEDAARPTDELVVCEGASDVVAAVAIGLDAVGRSSCGTGTAFIRELVRRRRVRRVSIVADDDPPRILPDGSEIRPGIDGARRLAANLRVPVRILLPPPGFKDLRDWFRAGALTPDAFARAADSAVWTGPNP